MNNAEGLKRTIESVINQTYKDFEFIIIDGLSKDKSVETIELYNDRITYWISETDSGIYNAMNKGILKASGEYCLFLNSGDILSAPDILQKVTAYGWDKEIIYGNGIISKPDGKTQNFVVPDVLTLDYFYSGSLFHPSTFIKRTLFSSIGLYNESNKIVSDWEFFLNAILIKNSSTRHLPVFISVADSEGISYDINNRHLISEECNHALNKYFPDSVIRLLSEHKRNKAELNWLKSKTFFRFLFKIRKIKNKYSDQDLIKVFSGIYENNAWGGIESISGPGSDSGQTALIRHSVGDVLRVLEIKSIIDAPCGDFNWMKDIIDSYQTDLDSYLGVDIVDELILINNKKFANHKIRFEVQDLTKSSLINSDLIICRDCFVHLTFLEIYRIINNFKESGSKYLLLSTYTCKERRNIELQRAKINFRVLNMEKYPFNLTVPKVILNEGCTEFNGDYSDKALGLWELNKINSGKILFNILIFQFTFLVERIIRKVKKVATI